MVSAAVNPASHRHFLAFMARSQFSASMCFMHLFLHRKVFNFYLLQTKSPSQGVNQPRRAGGRWAGF
jgi:hypothetical protein